MIDDAEQFVRHRVLIEVGSDGGREPFDGLRCAVARPVEAAVHTTLDAPPHRNEQAATARVATATPIEPYRAGITVLPSVTRPT